MHPIRCGRSFVFATISLFAALASAQSDLGFEPYTVFVAEESAHARCGPSGDYYRTDPLRHGQALEVYAETDDGWLGIRPPDDSFCWIPADAVETEPNSDEAVVVEDRTVAWIGTHLGRARKYRWQVQLAKGESVAIVGKSEREGPDGPQLWYRIVPPSGEYRWVHRDQVVDNSEELVASIRSQPSGEEIEFLGSGPTRPRIETTRMIRGASEPRQQPTDDFNNASSSRRTTSIQQSGQSIMSQSAANAPQQPAESWAASENRVASNQSPQRPAAIVPPPVRDDVPAPAPTAPSVTEAMKKGGLLASVEFLGRPKLLEIGASEPAPDRNDIASDGNWVSGSARPSLSPAPGQFQLNPPGAIMPASAISTNPNAIVTASLQQPVAQPKPAVVVPAARIAQIQAETRNADVDRLSLILSRLMASQATAAEVEPLAQAAANLANTSLDSVIAGRARLLAERIEQYRRVASRRDGAAVISMANPSVVPTSASSYGPAESNNGLAYSGFLVQVYSTRSNSPPFALTDNTGKTIAYVSPTPGVNLRPHLNSKITVSGQQGYLTGLNTPHIVAVQAARSPE